jgi:hypothetical protein
MAALAHDRRGDGPPLVRIHGIGSRWQVFAGSGAPARCVDVLTRTVQRSTTGGNR